MYIKNLDLGNAELRNRGYNIKYNNWVMVSVIFE